METHAPQKRTWHVSRGYVFANDTRVAYPRLSLARYSSAPVLATHETADAEPVPGALPRASTSTGQLCENVVDDKQVLATENCKPVEQRVVAVDTSGGTVSGAAVTEQKEDPEDDAPPRKPPFTPLEFKIPDELFQAAKKAPQGAPESFWSYNLYRGPKEAGSPKVKVHYCVTKHTTERVLQQYFMNEKILGFDLEWASDATKNQGPRRNVSLIQIASPSRIGLFHLALYPKDEEDMVAPTFRKIMEDPQVTKAGVWIKGDCTRLRRYLGIESKSIFELSHLYKLVKYTTGELDEVNKKLVGMANQVNNCLKLPLFKGLDVRTSDWSRPLKMEQIIYSASDAYAAVQLYHVLDHQRQSLDPTPPLPHHADQNLPIRLADQVIHPAAEEEAEAREDLPGEPTAPESNIAFSNFVNSVDMKSSVNLEEDDSAEQPHSIVVKEKTSSTAVTAATATATEKRKSDAPKDSRVLEAEAWARERCTGPQPGKAPAYILRAYYLWHKNADLDVEGVAAVLRDPPLATMTVVGYIADAIRQDKLVYDRKRLQKEVLSKVPDEILHNWRWRALQKACKGDGED